MTTSDTWGLDWMVSVDDHIFEPLHLWQSRVPEALKELAPLGREEQRVGTAVVRVSTALEQASLLEGVDERNHSARHHAHALANRLLRDAFGHGDRP